ncbi:MAG TPA: hypothetical protein VFE42_04590 [Chloroflexota bacterium]|jgi:hypothetical protein|nr:hypothetical protein [Chloroflexota bacterium]
MTATNFRALAGVAAVLFLIGLAAVINHFIQPANSHPFFGLKLGGVLILIALAGGVYANYNRPGTRA